MTCLVFVPEGLYAAREKHLREAANERRKFRKHQEKARTNSKYMTLIVDGMTQATTQLPHFERKPSWVGKDQLDCHVIGSIIEDVGVYLEFSYKNIGDDANVVIDNVHKAIIRTRADRKAKGKAFPEVLYLQLDNVSHNKGMNLYTYLSFLVHTGVFRKVKVNYLLVGHTHENIDQVFSRFSMALRRRNCLTLHELMECAKTCYIPVPTVEHVQTVTDWLGWFEENGCMGKFSDISFNHAFRIKKAEEEPVPDPDGLSQPWLAVRIHSKLLGWRENGECGKHWAPRGGVGQLKGMPEGSPSGQDLHELDDKEFFGLEKILAGFRDNFGEAFEGGLRDYWETQLRFQRAVREGDREPVGFEHIDILEPGTALVSFLTVKLVLP